MRLIALFLLAVAVNAAEEVPGARLYRTHCAQCHDAAGPARIPSKAALQKMAPEAILAALISGVMKQQGAALSEGGRQTLATWLGAPVISAVPTDQLADRCPADVSEPAADAPAWTGWGAGPSNWRYQPAAQAGLSAATVPHLKLKWAFGIPKVNMMRSQPAVYRGRVYVGGDDGTLYSLDAATGCVHWASKGKPVRSAIVIGKAGSTDAVFFGDVTGAVNALDVDSGKLLWRAQAADQPMALITGAPAYADGRLYVPLSSYEEASAMAPGYPCCKFRGTIAAIDAASGKIVWRAYTIAEKATERGKAKDGRAMFGPSGAGVWASPAVDTAKHRIYIATGDNYSDPPSETSDALLALDLDTGKLLWSKQFTKGDTYNMACAIPGDTNCPAPAGPDFDFGASPILVTLPSGKRAVLMGQKSGMLYAVDPDDRGALLWQARAGEGGALGGIQWGPATDGKDVYVAVSDLRFGRSAAPSKLAFDPKKGGGISAFRIADGKLLWKTPAPGCGERRPCSPAQSAAVTAIPGAVFSGSLDGHLRAYATDDGKIIWDFDTARPFDTVNHVPAKGGSLDAAGPVVAGGMLFVVSGYPQYGGMPGNVLLAFGN